MNILILYDKFSTFTNAVYDHLMAFSKYSENNIYYAHSLPGLNAIPLVKFDVIVVHYSVRLAFDALPLKSKIKLSDFKGRKVLFVQDEYDNTDKTRAAIDFCGFDLVFTCVPRKFIGEIYPESFTKNIRFINTLTGYVNGESLPVGMTNEIVREIDVGYRGRELPYWYGDLGQEKVRIAEGFISNAGHSELIFDISCKEEDRFYGDDWIDFLKKCKATLGTESGCNIFDKTGSVRKNIIDYLDRNPGASYNELKKKIFEGKEEAPVMNQVSPRLFEAVEYGAVLILFEGEYSGIFKPWKHFIPLKKDFSNVDEVIEKVKDRSFLKNMSERAYNDIIASGKYTYESFIKDFDREIDSLCAGSIKEVERLKIKQSRLITCLPQKYPLVKVRGWHRKIWLLLPQELRSRLKPVLTAAIDSFNKKF